MACLSNRAGLHNLRRILKNETPEVQVVNASISGETTAGGLRRLPLLLQENQPSIVIIELGANDGLRGYPVADPVRSS